MAEMIAGREVYRSLVETIEPKHTALIVVDMQNDFCSDEGHFGKCGIDLAPIKEIRAPLARLVRSARERGLLIVYLKNTHLPGGAYFSPCFAAHMMMRWGDESRIYYTFDGTWGHDIIDEMKPEPGDLIVKKHRASGFVGTDLDLILRSRGRKSIIVTGVVTDGCVESTARDGLMRDYYVVVAKDCVASSKPELHKAQMTCMGAMYHFVVPSSEILGAWGNR